MYILTHNTVDFGHWYLYVYDYELYEEGNIRTEYSTNNKFKIKKDLGYDFKGAGIGATQGRIICFNQTDTIIYVLLLCKNTSPNLEYSVLKLEMLSNDFIVTQYEGPTGDFFGGNSDKVIVSDDDKYVLLGIDGSIDNYGMSFISGNATPFIFNRIENGEYTPLLGIANKRTSMDSFCIDSQKNIFIRSDLNQNNNQRLIFYNFSLDEHDVPSLTQSKIINLKKPTDIPNYYSFYCSIIDKIGDTVLLQIIYVYYRSAYTCSTLKAIGTIDISDIDNMNSEDEIEFKEVIYTPVINKENSIFCFMPYSNLDKSRYILNPLGNIKESIVVLFDIESRKLIGVRYKGQSFYNYLPNYTEESSEESNTE